MAIVLSKFTVLFEDPFWIGLYERQEGQRYEVCKVTFGAEPKDYQVLAFLLQNWDRLPFSRPESASAPDQRRISPKRMQRLVRKQVLVAGFGKKAQLALKRQQEQDRQARKDHSRAARSAQKERQFLFRQKKRKEKHRGR